MKPPDFKKIDHRNCADCVYFVREPKDEIFRCIKYDYSFLFRNEREHRCDDYKWKHEK